LLLFQALRSRQNKRNEMMSKRISYALTSVITPSTLTATTSSSASSSSSQSDITLVLIVVICAFIVCQTPTLVDHVMWTFVDAPQRHCGRWHYYYTAVSDFLAILNSSINFVIYVLTSRKFRQQVFACLYVTRAGADWTAMHFKTETEGGGVARVHRLRKNTVALTTKYDVNLLGVTHLKSESSRL